MTENVLLEGEADARGQILDVIMLALTGAGNDTGAKRYCAERGNVSFCG